MNTSKKSKAHTKATRLATNQDIESLDKKITTTQKDVKKLDKKLDKSVERLDKKIDDSVERLDKKITATQKDVKKLDKKLDKSVERLDKKIDDSVEKLSREIKLMAENVVNQLMPALDYKRDSSLKWVRDESKRVFHQESVDMVSNIERNQNEIIIAGSQIDENRRLIEKHERILSGQKI